MANYITQTRKPSTSQRTSAPPVQPASRYTIPATAAAIVCRFLQTLHGANVGYIQLGYIVGNPKDKDEEQSRLRGEWHYYTPERATAIAERAAQLAQQYGDVYTTASRYSQRTRSKDTVLPGAVVFVDDVTPGNLPAVPTVLVETSAGNYQAIFMLDAVADVATRENLAYRLILATGGDASGYDATQVIRLPIGYNTKHQPAQPVSLAQQNTVRYSVSQLDALLPTAPMITSDNGLGRIYHGVWCGAGVSLGDDDCFIVHTKAMMLKAQSAYTFGATLLADAHSWLANIKRLLQPNGLPRGITKPFAIKLFTGGIWADSSAYRYAIAKSLILHGYPDAEVFALLMHFCDVHQQRKKITWQRWDTLRCIAENRASLPAQRVHYHTIGNAPKPAVRFAPGRPVQPKQPKPTGRPRKLDAMTLWQLYKQLADTDTHYCAAQGDVAKITGASRSTIARLERTLTQQRLIERQTRGALSWIIFKDAENTHVKNPDKYPQNDHENSAISPTFDTPIDATFSPLESAKPASVEYEDIYLEGTHPPVSTSAFGAMPQGGCVPSQASQPAPAVKLPFDPFAGMTIRPAAAMFQGITPPANPTPAALPTVDLATVRIIPARRRMGGSEANEQTADQPDQSEASSPPPAAVAAKPASQPATPSGAITAAMQRLQRRENAPIANDITSLRAERARLVREAYSQPKANAGKVWAKIHALDNRILGILETLAPAANLAPAPAPAKNKRRVRQIDLVEAA